MRIRKATLSDIDHLARIDKACFASQASTAENFVQMVNDEKTDLWIADGISGPVGYILGVEQDGSTDATLNLRTGEDYVLQIASIAVLPTYAGQKIGQKLLAHLEPEANVQKVSRFISEVALDNDASQKLFAKSGYQHIETLENYYGANKNAHRFQKNCPCL